MLFFILTRLLEKQELINMQPRLDVSSLSRACQGHFLKHTFQMICHFKENT